MTPRPSGEESALIVMIGLRACAIPLRYVIETMRPLPIEPIAGMPDFVRGVSVIRGEPIPVIDLSAVLNGTPTGEIRHARYGRFATLRVEQRRVALAVNEVVGIRTLQSAQLAALPPLLSDVGAGAIQSISTCDEQLLLVLCAAHLLPESSWATLPEMATAR